MGAALRPLRLPGFANLSFAYLVNELGNWLGEIALAVLVFDQTNSPMATAALFFGMHFTPALLGPPLVSWLEALPVRASLPLLYAAEALAFGVLALFADDFLLVAVLVLAAIDGSLASASRALTRAAAAAALAPARPAPRGQRPAEHRVHRRLGGGACDRRGRRRERRDPGRALGRRRLLPHRRLRARGGAQPAAPGRARAPRRLAGPHAPRPRLRARPGRPAPAAGRPGARVRLLRPRDPDRGRVREADPRRRRRRLRRAARQLGGRDGGRQPALRRLATGAAARAPARVARSRSAWPTWRRRSPPRSPSPAPRR